jgi:hypothetical protein
VHKHKNEEVKTTRYGRSNHYNNWPGNGPFSNLPPWERPGRLYGRGACYRLYTTPNITPITPTDETTILTQQKNDIETQIKNMQTALSKIQERLNEINK